ncbi:MAG: lipid-A-disaccharide synthase-related protein [Candidatus Eremiobacterota bacterium]
MKQILFLSNGYGEDTIAAYIIENLRKKTDSDISAFPLVGTGKSYQSFDITIVGPCRDLPSAGDLHSPVRLFQDIKSGLFNLLLEQYLFLRKIRKNIHIAVASGDIYPVIMASFAGIKPLVFIGTAKSNRYYPYSYIEKFLIKSFCKITFTRDLPTCEDLKKFGINSIYAGNPMMNCFEISGETFGIEPDRTVIGILPGSRDVAYRDFPVILSAVEQISRISSGNMSFLAALSPSIEEDKLPVSGWNFYRENPLTSYLKKDNLEVKLIKNKFGDIINRADIVIGQAGTGNEQTAGLGKPVVAFDSDGHSKPGWYRARQKGLLGDSLSIVNGSGEAIAREILSILEDEKRRDYMAKTGRDMMEDKDCVNRISEEIIRRL